jgi:hypothetical protein
MICDPPDTEEETLQLILNTIENHEILKDSEHRVSESHSDLYP